MRTVTDSISSLKSPSFMHTFLKEPQNYILIETPQNIFLVSMTVTKVHVLMQDIIGVKIPL